MTTVPRAKRISEPPRIAALEHISGLPLAYVAQRYPMKMPPEVDSKLGYVAMEDSTSGVFEPDMGHMGEERQRVCMLSGICQVCGHPIKGTRWMAGGVGDRPLASFAFREPPCCTKCMTFAIQVCPGLIRGRRAEELVVVRVRRFEEMWAERQFIDGPHMVPMEPRFDSVCMYLRVTISGTVYTPERFLAMMGVKV